VLGIRVPGAGCRVPAVGAGRWVPAVGAGGGCRRWVWGACWSGALGAGGARLLRCLNRLVWPLASATSSFVSW